MTQTSVRNFALIWFVIREMGRHQVLAVAPSVMTFQLVPSEMTSVAPPPFEHHASPRAYALALGNVPTVSCRNTTGPAEAMPVASGRCRLRGGQRPVLGSDDGVFRDVERALCGDGAGELRGARDAGACRAP